MLERWRLHTTVKAFCTEDEPKTVAAATAQAFGDSSYEQRLGNALRNQHVRTPANRALALNYSCWLDALSRNHEVIPLLETSLRIIGPDPQLACQLAWAIVEITPTGQFPDAEQWLTIAAQRPSLLINVTDTRAWMQYRRGAIQDAHDLMASLPDEAEAIPEVAYHRAAIAARRNDITAALFYLEHALTRAFPFAGIYDAMLLQAQLMQTRAHKREPQEYPTKIPLIDKFDALDNMLFIGFASGKVVTLSWDRIWELADATPEQRQHVKLTKDRLGLVWPEFKLALTSLQLEEAAMRGLAPPQDRPLYGMYPTVMVGTGIRRAIGRT